jgi:phosphatidylinositol-3-phosphatase
MKKSLVIIIVFCLVALGLLFLLPKSDDHNKTQPPIHVNVEKPDLLKGVTIPDHVVVVVEENHSYEEIVGNKKAPYMNSLFQKGAQMTNSHGVKHPSQPNYIALFSGDTHGIKDDSCPHTLTDENLATQLNKAGYTFAGYSEDLPTVGFKGCSSGKYARKHNPWVNFTNVSSKVNLPFSAFPKDFTNLPTVLFVIPNLNHDIHDGTIQAADRWLKDNLNPYVQWAKDHNSLLILTWDEDDFRPANHIPTLFLGPMIKAGKYGEYVDHYNVLRTIEALYNMPPLGKSGEVAPIVNIWR